MSESLEILDTRLDSDFVPMVQSYRDRMATRPPLHTITPAMMRERASAEFVAWNSDPQQVARVSDLTVLADGRSIPVRLYEPALGLTEGMLIHFHGGGWTIGDLDIEDAAIRRVALASGVRILSVDYRLAPEHGFPAPIEDGVAVFRWLTEAASALVVDPARIAIGGASAGATVALGTALSLRDDGGPQPAFLKLMYGAYSDDATTPAHGLYGDGNYGLSSAAMTYFWTNYAGADIAARHPYAVPLAADLTGLPPVFINHAGIDVLSDDSNALAAKLRAAGVPVEHRIYPGAIHGFTQFAKVSPVARTALEEAGLALAAAVGGGG